LGLRLGENEIKDLLTNVELNVNDELAVMPPFWRTDIELPEDIVEELAVCMVSINYHANCRCVVPSQPRKSTASVAAIASRNTRKIWRK
jgi:phenylalanyl-tRNA synthetase beta subunit